MLPSALARNLLANIVIALIAARNLNKYKVIAKAHSFTKRGRAKVQERRHRKRVRHVAQQVWIGNPNKMSLQRIYSL